MITILLDIDGVIADWTSHAIRTIGAPISHEDVGSYNLSDHLPEQLKRDVGRLSYRAGFCRGIMPYPGATSYLRALRQLGRVVALTVNSPGPYWPAERSEWLENYGFAARDIVLCEASSEKFSYPGDVLIEDNPETLDQRVGWVQLFDRPWNRHATRHARVTSYAESLSDIRGRK